MAPTQIPVHRWGLRTRISALFRSWTLPEFSFLCGAGYVGVSGLVCRQALWLVLGGDRIQLVLRLTRGQYSQLPL